MIEVSKCGVIDIGRACPNKHRCKICYHRFSDDYVFGHTNENLKSIQDLKKEVDHLYEQKRERIAITGGEPLIHPDLHAFLKYILDKGMLPQIITAGIPSKAKNVVKEFGDKVAWVLSIHGDPVMHNYIFGSEYAFDKILGTLFFIHESYYRFNYVVTSFNWQSLITLHEIYFPIMFNAYEYKNPFVPPTLVNRPKAINFLKWRPFYGWLREDHQHDKLISQYIFDNTRQENQDGLIDLIYTARDFTEQVNMRYFPMCGMDELTLKDEKIKWWSTLNYMFDPWEWVNENYKTIEAKKIMTEKWERGHTGFYYKDSCGHCQDSSDYLYCQGFMKGWE